MIARWFVHVTEQACTFPLLFLAHSSTNIKLWNLSMCREGFHPSCCIPSILEPTLLQNQREAPSPNPSSLTRHVVWGCSCTNATEGLQAGAAGWCLSWQIEHFVAFFAQQILGRNRSLSWNMIPVIFAQCPLPKHFTSSIYFSMYMFFTYHRNMSNVSSRCFAFLCAVST